MTVMRLRTDLNIGNDIADGVEDGVDGVKDAVDDIVR